MKTKYFWDDEQMPSPKQKFEKLELKGEEKVNQLPKRDTDNILECSAEDVKKKDDIIHK